MPLYEFYCPICDATRERMMKIADLETTVTECHRCFEPMRQALSIRPGGTQVDHPSWLDDSSHQLLDVEDGARPFQTRRELKTYLKEKGLAPKHNTMENVPLLNT